MLLKLFGGLFLLLLILIIRVLSILPIFRRPKIHKKNTNEQVRVLSVLGSGGHTPEMLKLLETLFIGEERNYQISFVIASSDKTSQHKAKAFSKKFKEKFGIDDIQIYLVPRSRKVGQSYFSSIFTTLYASFFSFKIVVLENPKLVLCNGPGTCVPIALAAFLLRIISIKFIDVIYIESIARVKRLSLSGRILYPIADRFIVQWESLTSKYKKVEYIGRLI
ncbi:glycosyl transferase-related [Anaeramoeba flamelloides]|uniref:UDP-N-acetylglucosamine transferase subunit ALG14 n=1 Tax=Anaeramoeba flamelloides TaxID=1746091 RepID=A0ABQ8XJ06_9EUKA|nr:glycosyl transferase-related [Anaeramoeba flamelloides]